MARKTGNANPNLASVGPRLDAANSRKFAPGTDPAMFIARDSVDGLPCDDGSDPLDNEGGTCEEEASLRIKLS